MIQQNRMKNINTIDISLGKSIRGYTWSMCDPNENLVFRLMQNFKVNEITARIMINRDIIEDNDVSFFLKPNLNKVLPDPMILCDMEEAATFAAESITKNKKILVFGDYDVDGITSSSIIKIFTRDINFNNIEVYIPNRIKDGYGPSIELINQLISEHNPELFIFVDCGTSSLDIIDHLNSLNIASIILDHHMVNKNLPSAKAFVNPNREDDKFIYKSISASVVSFLFVLSLRKKLRSMHYFKEIQEPDLINLTPLAALGTICDVMMINKLNRAIVKLGLKNIKKNLGLSFIIQSLKIEEDISSYHLGYVIGPRLNAGGRVSDSGLAFRLLISDNIEEVKEILNKLEELNDERKKCESESIILISKIINENNLQNNNVIIVSLKNITLGILGVLASRIKEIYHKPTIIASIDEKTNKIKASARSIPGIDIGSMILQLKNNDIIESGGGHAIAGGFNCSIERFDSVVTQLNNIVNNDYENYIKKIEASKTFYIDSAIDLGAVNHSLASTLSNFEPFGNGNPMPRFVIFNVKITNVFIIRNTHIQLIVSNNESKKRKTIRCFIFRGKDNILGNFCLNNIGKKIDMVGFIKAARLKNLQPCFIVDDIIKR